MALPSQDNGTIKRNESFQVFTKHNLSQFLHVTLLEFHLHVILLELHVKIDLSYARKRCVIDDFWLSTLYSAKNHQSHRRFWGRLEGVGRFGAIAIKLSCFATQHVKQENLIAMVPSL